MHALLLKIIGAALFGGDVPAIRREQIENLFSEAGAQAVFSILFHTLDSQMKELLSSNEYAAYSERFLVHAIAGAQNFAEHGELHDLMTENNIPYTTLKGISSAMYYPDPGLRNMGDVDFLVNIGDLQAAGRVLEMAGFTVDHGEEENSKHIAYRRPPASIWEMHRSVNGIPENTIGERIKEEINRVIETSETVNVDGNVCCVPDKLHHGLILLLHTASHLTSEGVGLRHLCDWIVFASSMSDTEFKELFEKKLKEFGLWQFAQVLTSIGICYMGAPKRKWAWEVIESNRVDEEVLKKLLEDILNGGNFGTKDMNRYREIKYISDDKGKINNNGILLQGFKSLNIRVYDNSKIIRKYKILLPMGWIKEGTKYFGLLLSGKRKKTDTRKMFNEASERKRIYRQLKLFDVF